METIPKKSTLINAALRGAALVKALLRRFFWSGVMRAGAIYAFFGVLCKAVGVVYRIPLANALGASGLGLYYMVFPLYTLLLDVSAAAVPQALSKRLAEKPTEERWGYFLAVKRFILIISAIFSAAVFLFADLFASAFGAAELALPFRIISPSVFFASGIAALRGALQSKMHFLPSSLTVFLEQLVKAALSVAACAFVSLGIYEKVCLCVGAITLSEAVSFLFARLAFARRKRSIFGAERSSGCGNGEAYGKGERDNKGGVCEVQRSPAKDEKTTIAVKAKEAKNAVESGARTSTSTQAATTASTATVTEREGTTSASARRTAIQTARAIKRTAVQLSKKRKTVTSTQASTTASTSPKSTATSTRISEKAKRLFFGAEELAAIRSLFAIALPLALVSAVYPLISAVDALFCRGIAGGQEIYGVYSGTVLPVIGAATTVITAFCSSGIVRLSQCFRGVKNAVPLLATRFETGKAAVTGRGGLTPQTARFTGEIRSIATVCLAVVCGYGVCSVVGGGLLARLLYPSLSEEHILIAAAVITSSAPLCAAQTLAQFFTSVSTAMNLPFRSVASLAIGFLAKTAYLAITASGMGVFGGSVGETIPFSLLYSSFICYFVAMTVNLLYIIIDIGSATRSARLVPCPRGQIRKRSGGQAAAQISA